jgi:uncharacterized protein YcfL
MKTKSVGAGLKTTSLVLVAVSVIVAMTAGCLSRAKRVTDQTPLDTQSVVMKDMAVTTNVALSKEWSEVVNGMLKAHMILRNNRNTTVNLEVKTIFKDGQGVAIKTFDDTWHPIMILSNEEHHYEEICPVIGAASYQFLVKTAGK